MIEKLTKVWENLQPLQLANIFERYMESIGVKKYDGRRKDNKNTYMIDGKSTNWNKVECYYYKDSAKYCEENLQLVLRKRSGDYFIVQRGDNRAFEVDHSGLRNYDETLLIEIIGEHKLLFDVLIRDVKEVQSIELSKKAFDKDVIISEDKFLKIKQALKNYISAWYEIPKDINVENLNIESVRYIQGFKTTDDEAWIVTFSTEIENYRELLMDDELELSIEEYKESLEKEEKSMLGLAKDVLCRQSYHRYPIVYKNSDLTAVN